MTKDEQSNQLNLTVIALVALVAIVGLVALVMNAASIKSVPQFATGSQIAAAQADENAVGQAKYSPAACLDACLRTGKQVLQGRN